MAIKKGRFYFKQTTSGNLLGEYGNEGLVPVTGTESAVMREDSKSDFSSQPFVGEYDTCWLEGTIPTYAELEITPRLPLSSNTYKLKWKDANAKQLFEGEGFIAESMLIGSYV